MLTDVHDSKNMLSGDAIKMRALLEVQGKCGEGKEALK